MELIIVSTCVEEAGNSKNVKRNVLVQVKVVSGKYTGIVARIEERDVRKGTATVLLRSAYSYTEEIVFHSSDAF